LRKRERESAATTRTTSAARGRSTNCIASPAPSPPRSVRSEENQAIRLHAHLPRHHGRPRRQGGNLLLQLLTPRHLIEETSSSSRSTMDLEGGRRRRAT
jgi:hypothetical protein